MDGRRAFMTTTTAMTVAHALVHAHVHHHDSGDGGAIGSGSAANVAEELLEHASLWKIAVTGLSLGVVHIVTGPDHLSALVALSNAKTWRAFTLGVQWGCGHALGIIAVAAICLSLGHTLELGVVRDLINYVIGIFLIGIGVWTLYHALIEYDQQTRPESKWSDVHCQDDSYTLLAADDQASRGDAKLASVLLDHDSRSVGHVQNSASICVGLMHGFAGPGGVLGVLPVVAMHHLDHSLVYLACFCMSSILCMGVFAALYGELTTRSSTKSALIAFRIALASSMLSMVVGVIWIVLQACGALEFVFAHHH